MSNDKPTRERIPALEPAPVPLPIREPSAVPHLGPRGPIRERTEADRWPNRLRALIRALRAGATARS